MAGDIGFEPMRVGIKIRCLNQLGESPTKLVNTIMITVEDAIQSLYNSVRGTYKQRTFATTARQFVTDPLLHRLPRQFMLDPLLVSPPGSDPGSPDFQSGAMTTSAKETNLVPGDSFELPTLSV